MERSFVSKLDPSRHLGFQTNIFGNKFLFVGGVHFNTVGDPEEVEFTKDANKDDGVDEGDETTKALRGCLESLREEDRVLLRNRYSGKNTLRAYAEETGRSEAGIRVSLHRLRKALKACVETKMKNE